ncbi:hypothetical protein [Streptomyces indicus]|uniref:hypothetical protein n=1 Tax=Streptomyces indicus TaxID=417292 RepID=UPI000A7F9BB4|nr:hypothetical protein [Streptomyces indicus]
MTFGFAPSTDPTRLASVSPPADASSPLGRLLEPAEWAAAGIPLLRDPRDVVRGLYERHRPTRETAVVAVLDQEERVRASASFARRSTPVDGWVFRNALLAQLRRVIPHDLRRRTPVHTAVLLYCRDGGEGWTEEDGAWMWGLRDACTLHGLRCGAYITLTACGWQVLGEGRGGRQPNAGRASAVNSVVNGGHGPHSANGAETAYTANGHGGVEFLRRAASL